MEVDKNIPIYVQIANIIENQILTGDLKEEDSSPSTNDFARIYDINPATARKGLNILVDEGVLYKKRGLGMFVNVGAKEKIIEKRKHRFLNETIPNLLKEGERLNIDRDEIIDAILRRGEE